VIPDRRFWEAPGKAGKRIYGALKVRRLMVLIHAQDGHGTFSPARCLRLDDFPWKGILNFEFTASY